MLEVLRITETMTEEIMALCRRFDNPRIGESGWRSLLDYPWKEANDPAGYVLSDKGRIVGFLGTIFSHPIVNGEQRTICNISSYIVEPKYQIHGGALLMDLLRSEDTTITNLSSAEGLLTGMRRLGFKTLEDTTLLVSPLSAFPDLWSTIALRFIEDSEKITTLLSDEDKRIFHDHSKYPCRHLVVVKGNQRCYLVYNFKEGSRYRYAYVHYVSDPAFYAKYAGPIAARLYLKEKVARVACDQRLLKGHPIRFGKRVPLTVPRLYRPSTLTPENISNVYSELVMLSL